MPSVFERYARNPLLIVLVLVRVSAILNLGLGLDFATDLAGTRHHAGAWLGVSAAAPMWCWATLHLSAGLLIALGLRRSFAALKAGLRLAAMVMAAEGLSFLYGAVFYQPATTAGFLLCTSWAMVLATTGMGRVLDASRGR